MTDVPARTWRTPVVVLIAGTLVIMFSYGIRQSFGLFLQPVTQDMGWGRESFSFALALQNLIIGLAVPFVGGLADRYGAGKVVGASGVLYAAGLLIMSQATTPAGMVVSASLLVGLAVSGCGFPMILAVIGRAVPEERRSLYFGIATAGGTAGQLVVVPASQQFIAAWDWVTAATILAAMAALIVPLAAALAEPPRNAAAQATRQSVAEALREASGHRGFWLLTLGFFVCGFQVQFIAMHLPAYLVDAGASAALGATAIALIGLFNMFGTYLAGMLGGRFRKKYLLSYLYLGRSLVMLVFIHLPATDLNVMVFAALIGILWLGTVPLTSGIVAQIFGTQYMAMLYGIVFLSHQVGSFMGVWMGGYLFDLTGSYMIFWWAAIAAGGVAALLHWPIDDRKIQRAAAAG